MRLMLLAAAGLVAANSLAQAADLPLKAAPYAPVVTSNWTGFYIGGFVGGMWADGNFCTPLGVPVNNGCHDFKVNGVVGGGYVGYDYELPNRIVLGVRVSAPFGSVSDTQSAPSGFGPVGSTIAGKFKWAFLGTGTVGYDLGPWLPFVGLGVAVANVDVTFTNPFFITTTANQTQAGLNIVTGFKYAMTRNWAFGLQYNHVEFERENYNFPGLFFPQVPVKLSQDSVIGTVDYRF